jgi:indole-3-glycerol phosphate synthase
MSVLDDIIRHKVEEVRSLTAACDASAMRSEALASPVARDLVAALRNCPRVPIIAEIKRASPSAGTIKAIAGVADQARQYEAGGAAALSVLTDQRFFKGTIEDLREARSVVSLPVLRKDFIVSSLQIHEARIAGADAVLLIVAALSKSQLNELFQEVASLGMTAVVEVHEESELPTALELKPAVLGINNRDLKTMKVNIDTCARLRPLVPSETLVLGESGIERPEDIRKLRRAGVDAFLIGTTLMRSANPSETLAALCNCEE